MTAHALAVLHRIILVSFSKIFITEIMACLAELYFLFDEIILILRTMGHMAGKTSVGKGLMLFVPVERGPGMTDITLFVSRLFLEEFILRGMGAVAWHALALL